MKKPLLLTIVFLLLHVHARTQEWIPCNLVANGNNAYGTAVCVHNGVVYASNSTSGLQKSTNHGETWTVVNANFIGPDVNLYSTGDRLYALITNLGCTDIAYSTDDGKSFQIDTTGLPLCFANATTIPSAGGKAWKNHMIISVAGPDWEFSRSTSKPGWDDASYFDANDCSEFYVKNDTCWAATNGATSNGVAWSTDGLQWTSPMSTGIPAYYVPTQIAWLKSRLFMMGMDVSKGNAGKDTILKISDDYGLSFNDVNIKQYLTGASQQVLDMFAAYDHLYIVLSNNLFGSAPDLIVSTDRGQSFVADTVGFPAVPNSLLRVKDMEFLDTWAFAQLNTGDLFRKQLAFIDRVDSEVADEDLIISPNPANSTLRIGGTAHIQNFRITNVTGLTLMSGNASIADISRLESGVYFVSAETSRGPRVRKFVKY